MIGLPVAGWVGFAFTSIVDAWTGGYAEPGFWGTAGLALAGTGVAASIFGVTVGVTDFDIPVESTEEGRCGSARRLA